MRNIKSQIAGEDVVLLALKIPRMVSGETSLLYSSDTCGIGFHSIESKILGYTGPWLLLIEHTEKNLNNEREHFIFGSFQNGPIRDTNIIQGDLTGFMFSINPKIRFMSTDKGEGGSNYFFINNIPE